MDRLQQDARPSRTLHEQTEKGPTLSVMTFNLLTSTKKARSHPWRERKRVVADIINTYRPDVLGTQEANLPQLRELAELLPDYEFVGEGNLGVDQLGSLQNWYCATFYRRESVRPAEPVGDTYWLSPTPDVPASQFHFGTRPRLVTWNTFEHMASGKTFLFGTTHLEALNAGHRLKSVQLIRRYVSEKVRRLGTETPVFLTGDFNAVADSPEIKAMSEHVDDLLPMYDAWADAGPECPRQSATFRGIGLRDWLGKLLFGPRRIDYVFFRGCRAVNSVLKVDFDSLLGDRATPASDHFPVLANFQFAR